MHMDDHLSYGVDQLPCDSINFLRVDKPHMLHTFEIMPPKEELVGGLGMTRTKPTKRQDVGGNTPRKQLAVNAARKSPAGAEKEAKEEAEEEEEEIKAEDGLELTCENLKQFKLPPSGRPLFADMNQKKLEQDLALLKDEGVTHSGRFLPELHTKDYLKEKLYFGAYFYLCFVKPREVCRAEQSRPPLMRLFLTLSLPHACP